MECRRRSRERTQRGEKEKRDFGHAPVRDMSQESHANGVRKEGPQRDQRKPPGFPCSSGVCSGGEDAYLKPLEADGVDRSLSSYRAWELTAR